MDEYVSVIGESFTNLDDAVKVILRIRPPLDDEKENVSLFEIASPQQLNVKIPSESWTYKNIKRTNSEGSYNFEFSNIFDWNSTQEKVFSGVINSVVYDFLSGRNSLLFTYGITNSGKTYTLIGKPNDAGILPRTLDYLFNCISKYNVATKPLYKSEPHRGVVENDEKQIIEEDIFKQQLLNNHARLIHSFSSGNPSSEELAGFECNDLNQEDLDNINIGLENFDIPDGLNTTYYVYMSIAEIYNEYIYDLLDPSLTLDQKDKKRCTLKVQGDQKNGFYVKNLRNVIICNTLEAMKFLQIGLYHRRMAATKMNINSSRSHVIYNIRLVRSNELPNGQIATKSNEICFVDLAGAERQKSTFVEGGRLKEASNINKSLLFLGRCIEEMKQYRLNLNKNIVVSYRESKLTRLLQPFFVGRASMILLVNISPSINAFDDTINVLKFSALTKEALSRPLGIELQQAARTDAMINDSDCIDLSECSNSELIQIIHNMRRKIVDAVKNSDKQNAMIREEMSQFTMKVMQELDEEKDRQLVLERKLLTETYLVKIDLLNEEINHLRSKLAMNEDTPSKKEDSFVNFKQINEQLTLELMHKEDMIKQLISDVEQYKMDSRDEIAILDKTTRDLNKQLESKSKEYEKLLYQYEDIKQQIILDEHIRDNQQNKLAKAQFEYENSIKAFEEKQLLLKESFAQVTTIAGNGFSNVKSDIKDLLNDILPFKSAIFGIKDSLQNVVGSVYKTVSDIESKKDIETRKKVREINYFHNLNMLFIEMIKKIIAYFYKFKQDIKEKLDNLSYDHTSANLEVLEMITVYSKKVNERTADLTRLCENLKMKENEYKCKLQYLEELQQKYNDLEIKNQSLSQKFNSCKERNEKNIENYNEAMRKLTFTEERLLILKSKLDEMEHDKENPRNLNEKQICLYETEIKGYKRLNDEYLCEIAKLEQMLSEKNQSLNAAQRLKRNYDDLNNVVTDDIKKPKN